MGTLEDNLARFALDAANDKQKVTELPAEIEQLSSRTCEWANAYNYNATLVDAACGHVYSPLNWRTQKWNYCPCCGGKIVSEEGNDR